MRFLDRELSSASMKVSARREQNGRVGLHAIF
jgi:hypothetical protein